MESQQLAPCTNQSIRLYRDLFIFLSNSLFVNMFSSWNSWDAADLNTNNQSISKSDKPILLWE
jgi:hypothetical protein